MTIARQLPCKGWQASLYEPNRLRDGGEKYETNYAQISLDAIPASIWIYNYGGGLMKPQLRFIFNLFLLQPKLRFILNVIFNVTIYAPQMLLGAKITIYRPQM